MATTYNALQTATLANNSTYRVTFSSIPQTFKHLIITGSCATQTGGSPMKMYINGDETGNYHYGEMYMGGSGAPQQYKNNDTSSSLGNAYCPYPYTSMAMGVEIVIANYTSSMFKNYLYRTNANSYTTLTQGDSTWGGAAWDITNPITQLALEFTSNPFRSGSKFTLYGLT